MADVDLSAYAENTVAIGPGLCGIPFDGTFDGNGHVIRNLSIADPSGQRVGLFGTLGPSGLIENLELAEARVMGHTWVGALVGYNAGGVVRGCRVTADVQGMGGAGGIAGISIGNASISDCRADVRVSARWSEAGGIAARNSGSTIAWCAVTGTVTGADSTGGVAGSQGEGMVSDSSSTCSITGGRQTGGIVGRNAYSGEHTVGGLVGFSDSEVSDCWAAATVFGASPAGGLIGENVYGFVSRCYSYGMVGGPAPEGGLVGAQRGGCLYEGCFYDCEVDALPPAVVDTAGIFPRSSVELMSQRTYAQVGWDFVGETANGTDEIWLIVEGQDYPHLWWEAEEE